MSPTRSRMALAVTAAVVALLAVLLHLPVFTRGALITPSGMHHAMWPWRASPPPAAPDGGRPLLEENPTLSDLEFQVYPWQLHMQRSLEAGSVPLWNPYSYCGVPFVANAQSAVFYPLHWPAWVFPSMRIFTFALLLKIVLAGLFMAIFLTSLGARAPACVVGSVSFALCSFMTSWLGYAHTNAAVTLPILMLAARMLARAPGAAGFLLLAFAGAAQYLGGHPETSLHIMGAAALYFLWNLPASPRPRLAGWLFVAAGLLGFLMAAVQMFPFLEYLSGSAALQQRQALAGMDPSLPARALAANLLPGMYGWPWRFDFHGPVAWQALICYTGAATLLLALLSLRWPAGVVFFQALAAASALVVYGPDWIRAGIRHLPVVGIGSNNRLTLIVSFCVAVLAAHALERLSQVSAGAPRPERLRAVAALAVAAAPLLAVIFVFRGDDPIGARLAASTVAGAALLAAVALLFRPGRRALYLGGIAALVCVDMFTFSLRFNPHADPGALYPATPLTDFLRQDAAADMTRGGRMMTVGWVMRPETQMIYRLSSIEGYDAMELSRYRRLLDRASVSSIHETGAIPPSSRPLLDLAGLRYIVTPPGGVVSGDDMTLGYDGPDGRVFLNERALPRFRFVEREHAEEAAGGDEALERLATGRVDPRSRILIEGRADAASSGAPSGAASAGVPPRITLERNTTGAIELTVAARDRAGYLVVGDAFDDGWRATVNGRPESVLRADYIFRAIPIPAGRAEVTMTYRPFWFRAGAWVSVLTLMFSMAVALVRWGRVGSE